MIIEDGSLMTNYSMPCSSGGCDPPQTFRTFSNFRAYKNTSNVYYFVH